MLQESCLINCRMFGSSQSKNFRSVAALVNMLVFALLGSKSDVSDI
jgi:hypothetical protein